MKRLQIAPVPTGYKVLDTGHEFDPVQGCFQEKRHFRRPVTREFLEAYRVEIHTLFPAPEEDSYADELWTIVPLECGTGTMYKIAFPRHENGVTTGRVTLFCRVEDTPSRPEIIYMSRMIRRWFLESLDSFHPRSK